MKKNIREILNNLSIIKEVTFFDFRGLDVHSKQCYKMVVSKAFNGEENYSYLYFDVDRLSILNDTYGKKVGDRALKNLLSIIKRALPENSIFCRIAGDEFSVILPNIMEEDTKKIESQIHEAIQSLSTIVSGLTITSAAIDSTKSSNIEDLENKTEEICSIQKQLKHKNLSNATINIDDYFKTFDDKDENGNNVWDTLNTLINTATDEHLRDLRFNKNYTFDEKVLKQDAFSIVSTLSRFIENGEEPTIPVNKEKLDEQFYPITPDMLDKKDSKFILDLMHSKNPEELLSNLNEEELSYLNDTSSNLLQYFIHDPHSNLLEKHYLKTYLAPKICDAETEYQALYISDVAIRSSNTSYGHSYSDMRIGKTADIIKKVLSQYREFNQTAFNFSEEDCHLIDQGGGNYLVLIPNQKAMNAEEIFKCISEINSFVNIDKTNSSFFVSCADKIGIKKDDIETFLDDVRALKDIADENKSPLKSVLLNGIDNANSLKKTLYDIAKYYRENVPDYDKIEKKQAFLSNVFYSFVSHQAIHNENIKNKKKKDTELDR